MFVSVNELPPVTRRHFLQSAAGIAGIGLIGWQDLAADDRPSGEASLRAGGKLPWFKHSLRWGQTNLTELDPLRFDLNWYRRYWKDTALQGIVVNAGGIVAFYPTEVPHHRRAAKLGNRDLFGEIVHAAHEDGLSVFARMDSNRADEEFYRAHPDWFARDVEGKPYKVTDLYVACVNSPYYDEYIPDILREVAGRYHPEGFTDNNWNGPMRHQPCFCENCQRKFKARTGQAIPHKANWNDPLYRSWILWNYERRLEIWDQFNKVTRQAGGPKCLWVGMMAGSQNWQSRVFRDDREIYRRTELIMLDHQRRSDSEGFQHNAETGKRLHCVGGWNKVIPESMAMYGAAEHNFRLAAKPDAEVKLWVLEGFAGGIQPWWHHVGTSIEDRRLLKTPESLWRWHQKNEAYLTQRKPVVSVGLVWSQRNMDFFGRDEGGAQVDDPWNGITQALLRDRIPYVPVHIDDIEAVSKELGLRCLILSNLAAMSDTQVAALRRFVETGGSLLATGASSACNEWGDARTDLALADILKVHLPAQHSFLDETKRLQWAKSWNSTYLRLSPELRASSDAPKTGEEVPALGTRHEVLRGFEETDLLAFGGQLEPLTVGPGAIVPLSFVPAAPMMPVENTWLREPRTEIPGLVLSEHTAGGRVAYLPADIDRRYARDYLPDHGTLLSNLVRWTLRDSLPLRVTGAGLVDCQLYRQDKRLILHLVNLSNSGTWRAPVQELQPIGPLDVIVPLPKDLLIASTRSLVSGSKILGSVNEGILHFSLSSISDHEVLIIE